MLKKALSLHQKGQLAEAAALYRKILAKNPKNGDALHPLGIIEAQRNNFAAATDLMNRAIELSPNNAVLLSDRGIVLHKLKRFSDALASLDRALAIKPDYPEALNNRGNTLHELKRFDDALASYDRAVAIKPDYAEAFKNRGLVLEYLGRLDEALGSFDRALAINPDYPEALNSRGLVLQFLRRFDEALFVYARALAISPDYAPALCNRGSVLHEMKRYDEAIASYDRSLAIEPSNADALNKRGLVLRDLQRLEEALTSYDRALEIKPEDVATLNNRGLTLQDLKRLDEALESFDRSLAIQPGNAETLNNRGMAKLLCGDFHEGWRDYEWRKGFLGALPVIAREWQGEDITNRSILIYAEQGQGDVIQFARYLPALARRGASVSFAGRPELLRLLAALGEEIKLSGSLEAGGPFDFQCALMSVPLRFGTDALSIPSDVPYLRAERDLVSRWKNRIKEHGFKIGIAWQGSPKSKVDLGRSIPLAEFIRLSGVPGVRLISLQKEHGLDQLACLPAGSGIEILGEDFDSGPDAFIDTAAVMETLDLIITSDTSIAHLAGALARPTWLALKYVPDWRWMLERSNSPWYPGMRLFRQQAPGDWKSVFTAIEHELQSLLCGGDAVQRVGLSHPIGHAAAPEPTLSRTSPFSEKNAGLDRKDRQPLLDSANLRIKRCRHGFMMFYANDTYIGRSLDAYGEFSEGEMELFGRILKPGMTVVDAGANIGAHTIYFAKAVGTGGRIYAFEPQRVLYQMLCGNIVLNRHGNVFAENAGLGSQSGSAFIPTIDYAGGGNFGGISLATSKGGEEVPLRTLDSYGLQTCHLLKIDVEGMELAVLQGAKVLVERHKPILYVENDRVEKSEDLIRWLQDHDYRLYWHRPRLFNPNNYFAEPENVFGDIVSINMLCVPGSIDVPDGVEPVS